MYVRWACANINIFNVNIGTGPINFIARMAIQCDVLRLLRMPRAKNRCSCLFSSCIMLAIAGGSNTRPQFVGAAYPV